MASAHSLPYIIDHVFFPPKLPQEDDHDFEKDLAMIRECEASLRSFQAHIPLQEHWRWEACAKMLSKMVELRDPCGDLISERLNASLNEMRKNGRRDSKGTHAQLAHLLDRRPRLPPSRSKRRTDRPQNARTIII